MTPATIIGCIILFSIALVSTVYLLRKAFGKKPVRWLIYNRNKLPHENYPEIIEWDEGDLFERDSYCDAFCGVTILAKVKSISHDGAVVIEKDTDGKLQKLYLCKFIKDWINCDLINRKKEQKQKDILSIIENDPVYNKFLNDYRTAFKEIKSN